MSVSTGPSSWGSHRGSRLAQASPDPAHRSEAETGTATHIQTTRTSQQRALLCSCAPSLVCKDA